MTDRFTKGYESDDRFRGVCMGWLWGTNPENGDVTLSEHFDRLDRVGQIEMLSLFIDFLATEKDLLTREQDREAGQ
jgi:hypothetical protein